MHFTSETSSNGVLERHFVLGDISGVLWSPTIPGDAPLLLAGHAGGMHKEAPGLVASAHYNVTDHGFTVAAVDAPGHGGRPRDSRDHAAVAAIQQARAAGEPIDAIVSDYSMSVARRAVPEWRATLDALQSLPEIGTEKPVGYGGVSLGVVTGLLLAAADTRIAAMSFGPVFVNDALLAAARQVTTPVEYRIPWNDKHFDRAAGIAFFDALGSADKSLHAHSGRRYPVPDHERASSARFFTHHVGRSGI
ncbi:alpha/beta hydrolase [Nocardia lasii]|uniref:Alpha/beta hydrolase n=1 Tax=Nocardia lasii TaxID=1616107 RepID=A0ABW1JN16_9NOCA